MALVSTSSQLRAISPGSDRFMTMNLMSAGPCTIPRDFTSYGRAVRRIHTRDNHTTADVEGAQTFIKTNTLTNKPDSFSISVRSKQEYNLSREQSSPQISDLDQTSRISGFQCGMISEPLSERRYRRINKSESRRFSTVSCLN